jgi:hypothetical protein
MAATVKTEDYAARTATNDMGKRTYQRAWIVLTTSRNDDAYTVGSASGLPVIGNTHPSDANAYCQSLQVQPISGWRVWRVTASYSTERQLNTSPTSDPAVITWNTEQFQRVAVFDNDGDLIVNSAGDPFDPPLMMDDSRRVVTIQKNLAVVPTWILDYQDAVNSDAFTVDGVSIGIGKAKMQNVSVGPVERRSSTAFRTVNFTIHLQRDGWALQPLDAGFREFVTTDSVPNPELKNILNRGDQQPVAAPVPLDGSGKALDNPSPTNCVFLTYNVYKTRAFSTLPLT